MLEVVRGADGAESRLVLRHVPADYVDIMGDFTDWEPVALQSNGADTWSTAIDLRPGTWAYLLRIDGGPWAVPEGLPAARGDFGRETGILVGRPDARLTIRACRPSQRFPSLARPAGGGTPNPERPTSLRTHPTQGAHHVPQDLRAPTYGLGLALASLAAPNLAQAQQRNDEEYTKLIHEYLQDDRITTELVDHLPASDVVPTPLAFNGRIVGTPGELTYASDIHRYMRAIADASPRATVWSIGKSMEGREKILVAIADAATIANLEQYKDMLHELTDPRTTSEERAQQIINGIGKPIYWVTSGMHSPETGGPEMLQELAYRLVVEETPFIQDIRDNLITFITPVIEVDGREKEVDTYYFNKDRPEGESRLPLMYWGKYVAHDNNRDGMGQFLALTRNVNRTWLEWTPTVMHDLHEAQSYLYTSTGTGPYNEGFDPITIGEWWVLAENDVLEMTKRGVPGVWTYGFYDGWTPNYMFTIAHAHNGIGRFYEVQSYGPDNRKDLRLGATTTSREWFRPNPPLPSINWGPRNNTNIQESALLFSLKYAADHGSWFLENYWLKNKRSVQKGIDGPVNAWVIPANQRRRADAVDMVNELLRQGLEIQRADKAFEAGGVKAQAGDYMARADQPFRTMADIYFSLQQFSLDNPRPYDDTGWTLQLMRNVEVKAIKDNRRSTSP